MRIAGFPGTAGRHAESASIRNLMEFLGVRHPSTDQPLSEAMCFGIAGGIGAGYSFCPSVIRYGGGSGVSIVGRHKCYCTDSSWYQGFADRLGLRTRVTETSAPGKAAVNLEGELAAGRPAVVWCARDRLPFLVGLCDSSNLWMHSFVVTGIDKPAGMARGTDRAAGEVELTLEALAEARGGICSHKYRTLTFDRPAPLNAASLRAAVSAGTRACAAEMLRGKIKTFSLPGLEHWSRIVANPKAKDGWPKTFAGPLMYIALRDAFHSIETCGTGGGLYRGMYADFLEEAAKFTGNATFMHLSATYRDLALRWTELAEACLPNSIKAFKQTKEHLRKKARLFDEKGEKSRPQREQLRDKLRDLAASIRAEGFPMNEGETLDLLADLRGRIAMLYSAEKEAAERLADSIH